MTPLPRSTSHDDQQLGCCIRYDLLQGSMKDVVKSNACNWKKSNSLVQLTYASLYVRLSKIEHGDKLHIWLLDRNNIDYLKKLKPDSNIHFWNKNYKDNMWVHRGISKLTNKRYKEGMLLLDSINLDAKRGSKKYGSVKKLREICTDLNMTHKRLRLRLYLLDVLRSRVKKNLQSGNVIITLLGNPCHNNDAL